MAQLQSAVHYCSFSLIAIKLKMVNRKRKQTSPAPSNRSESEAGPSTSDSIARLADIMSAFIERSSESTPVQPVMSSNRNEMIPIFDPERSDISAELWCNKIDELQTVFHWSEEATICFAIAKLKGLAQTWYTALSSVRLTWAEWKTHIITAFPAQRDFHQDLQQMLQRQKIPGESYAKYYYEKCSLLAKCKITNSDAVSCIIGGINDNMVKTSARASNYQTPELLYNYLSSLNHLNQPRVFQPSTYRPPQKHVKFQRRTLFKDRNRSNMHNNKKPGFVQQNRFQSKPVSGNACYKCGV